MPNHIEKIAGRLRKKDLISTPAAGTTQMVSQIPQTSPISRTTIQPPASSTNGAPNHANRDLWEQALLQLSPNNQSVIRSILPQLPRGNQQPAPFSIDDLIALTTTKRDECEKRRWKVEFGGKQIILRDLAEKVIVWLSKFREVGDVVVNFDPVHLALPWAAIRFLLLTVASDSQQMGALLMGTERIACLVNRCKVYEVLYMHGTDTGHALQNLRAALLKMYTVILNFLSDASRLHSKSTSARFAESILDPDRLQNILDDFQKHEYQVDIEAGNCERTLSHIAITESSTEVRKLQKLLQETRGPVMRVDDRVQRLWERSEQSEQSQILQWVSAVSYEENHKAARSGRTADTGEWLLLHERFRQWHASSASTIIWLHGIPGAGKTKLTSLVIDRILEVQRSEPSDEALAYFYCNRDEESRNNPISVLRSYVRQLSISRSGDALQQSLIKLYEQKKQTGFASGPLDIGECTEALLHYVNLFPQTIFILDALDECDPFSRKGLIRVFDKILGQAEKPLKIFISSRPDDDIKFRFGTGPNVNICATDNHDDIAKFVNEKLNISNEERERKLSARLQEDIARTLLDQSNGMFQWAALQIDQLLEMDRESDMRLRLGKLPADLQKAYDEIYAMIMKKPGSLPQIAERAFRWIQCSKIPLYASQLTALVCQDPESCQMNEVDIDIDFVLKACGNLLVVEDESRRCRFAHLSVAEYLESGPLPPTQTEIYLARTCLGILLDDTIDNHIETMKVEYDDSEPYFYRPPETLKETIDCDELSVPRMFAALPYAVCYWYRHVQQCEKIGYRKELGLILEQFLGSMSDSSPAYERWHSLLDLKILRFYETGIDRNLLIPTTTPLVAICLFGFFSVLAPWWEDGLPCSICSTVEVYSLLRLAAGIHYMGEGNVQICRRLIELGTNVNEVEGGRRATALQAAAQSESIEMVRLLLDHGADVNVKGEGYRTALHAAAASGRVEVVQLLLDHGADVNVEEGRFGTALQAAAYEGRVEVVQLLLDHGADVNVKGGYFGTALQAAAYEGRVEVVQLLLDHGADVNVEEGRFGTALQAAAYEGRVEVVQLLLDHGADVNVKGGYYRTALQAAAAEGSVEMVQLLLDHGADGNVRGGHFGTALQAAVAKERVEVFQLLLDRSAGVWEEDA